MSVWTSGTEFSNRLEFGRVHWSSLPERKSSFRLGWSRVQSSGRVWPSVSQVVGLAQVESSPIVELDQLWIRFLTVLKSSNESLAKSEFSIRLESAQVKSFWTCLESNSFQVIQHLTWLKSSYERLAKRNQLFDLARVWSSPLVEFARV